MSRTGRRAPSTFAAADAPLMASLDELEAAPRYAAWITELITPYLHGRILEVGAGRGSYSPSLAKLGELTAVEPSDEGFDQLLARLHGAAGATAVHGDLAAGVARGPFDAIVLLNVLEHIDDDEGALKEMGAALSPGGHVVLWVPAFKLLLGDFDRVVGHHRRYRLRPMRALVEGTGLEVVEARYRNLPGWFAWLILVRILRRRPTAGRRVSIFDRTVVPVVRAVECKVKMPFGQSILLIARKPSA